MNPSSPPSHGRASPIPKPWISVDCELEEGNTHAVWTCLPWFSTKPTPSPHFQQDSAELFVYKSQLDGLSLGFDFSTKERGFSLRFRLWGRETIVWLFLSNTRQREVKPRVKSWANRRRNFESWGPILTILCVIFVFCCWFLGSFRCFDSISVLLCVIVCFVSLFLHLLRRRRWRRKVKDHFDKNKKQ